MAFDGITVACIVHQLQMRLEGGRVAKIAQPEGDELMLTINTPAAQEKNTRLVLCADASLPLVYLTGEAKAAPMTAPSFCMLLRKHLQGGRILRIVQPSLERILNIEIEHMDEMGDLATKTLHTELMGKHSNIILTDESDTVLDSVKRIPSSVSSVREVLPGRDYFIPDTMGKLDPLTVTERDVLITLRAKPEPVFKALYTSFTGISPVIAQEVCFRADVDADKAAASLDDAEATRLCETFTTLMTQVKDGDFAPELIYLNDVPTEYAAVPLTMYHGTDGVRVAQFSDISSLIVTFYREKETRTRIRQKSSDLRRIVQTALERTSKKLDLQMNQLKDTEKKDKYRLYGELLTAYAYQIKEGEKKVTLADYNTGKEVSISLDPQLSPSQNAARYYDRYNKLKRTAADLTERTKQVLSEVHHLQSVAASLDIARKEEDLVPIREELVATGYIRKRPEKQNKAKSAKSLPMHFVSSDGFDLYVGRNNFQNDELTKKAAGEDWWFHVKGLAGSHVILKTDGKEVPDRAFEEAAALAAYYSVAKDLDKTEVDYVQRKEIKKPSGAKPGFVVYYTNYSMVIAPKTLPEAE